MKLEQVKQDMAINTMVYYIANNIYDVFSVQDKFIYHTDENCCEFLPFSEKEKSALVIDIEEFVEDGGLAFDGYDESDYPKISVKDLDKIYSTVAFHYSRWLYNHKDVAKEVA